MKIAVIDDYQDAFRVWVLLRMVRSTGLPLLVPTLAFIGFLVVGLPFMTFTIFAGVALFGATFASVFHHVETSLRAGNRV